MKTDSVAVLRECPFCGGEAMTYHDEVKPRWVAACAPCGFIGPGEHESRDAAAAAWNRRALSAQGECRLHPRYKAVHPPRSTKPDCTCQQVYDAKHPAPPGADAVTEEMAADVLHRFNATAPSGDHWPPERARELRVKAMQQAITNAALAARTGKGEANG